MESEETIEAEIIEETEKIELLSLSFEEEAVVEEVELLADENVKANGTCGKGLKWVLDSDGVLTISGTGAMKDYGTSSNSDKVPWDKYKDTIQQLVISEGVTSIGDYAFSDCMGLTGELKLPSSLTSIGDYAFSDCMGLTGELKLPSSLTSIGYDAFYNCIGFTGNLVIPDSVTSIGSSAFDSCTGFTGTLKLSENLKSIESGAFSDCINLTGALTIPDNVTEIGYYAFENCSGFTGGLQLPSNLTRIGYQAFYNCSGFTGNLIIPSKVTIIDEHAFYRCEGFTGDLTIPENVESIESSAFWGCKGFTGTLTISDGVKDIGGYAFVRCGFTGDLIIPSSIESIGHSSFAKCMNLQNIIFEGSVPTIESKSFYDVIVDVYYPSEKSAWEAAKDNYGGTLNWIPYQQGETPWKTKVTSGDCGTNLNWNLNNKGVLTISGTGNMTDYTGSSDIPWYNQKEKIKRLVIEDGVTSISNYAFKDCTNLGKIIFQGDKINIGTDAFSGATANVYYPLEKSAWEAVKDQYGGTLTWFSYGQGEKPWKSIVHSGTCGEHVTWTLDDEGVLTISGTGAMKDYQGEGDVPWWDYMSDTRKLVIENGITRIGSATFEGCWFEELTIPESVTSIGDWAFSYCKGLIKNFTIPSTITSIGNGAFYQCYALVGNLTIPEGVVSIGDFAFEECRGLTGDLVIPDGVMSIGDSAFFGCSGFNGKLVIPESVRSIDSSTFSHCSGFKNVVFEGEAPNINDKAFYCVKTDIFYPSEVSGWEVAKDKNYGGSLTWKSYKLDKLLTPTANKPSGSTIKKGTSITLSCAVSGTEIYYTTDGSAPSKSSTKYTAPISITSDTTIKAIAVKSGYQNSEVATFTYTVKQEEVTPPNNSPSQTPDTPSNTPSETPKDDIDDSNDDTPTETPPIEDAGDVDSSDVPEDGEIPQDVWVTSVGDAVYTGSAIKPEIRVYDGKNLLEEGKDYTASYKNNVNVNTSSSNSFSSPQIVINLKGSYSGSQIVYFKIQPVDISTGVCAANDLVVKYTGKKQTPTPTLLWNGKKLSYGKDFDVTEYNNGSESFTEAGTHTLTLKGKNNFTGERKITLTISDNKNQIDMNKVTVKGISNKNYTGSQITQTAISVTYKKAKLTENNDYTISYGANTDVGVGTVTFTGTGKVNGDGISYIGSKTVTFKITGGSISKAKVSGIEKQYPYTGKLIKPTATLTYQANKNSTSTTLREGTDYTVTYKKNKNKGTATIIFTGINGYTGTKKQSFKIGAGMIDSDTKVDFKDTAHMENGIYVAASVKGGVKPEVIVKDGSKTLELGKDYTVKYKNNKKVADYTAKKAPSIIIKGKGNYKGSKTVTFTIK